MGNISGPDGGVGNIAVLKNQPNSEHALHLLYRLHSLVKPIMKAHGWYLPTLAEFFPNQPNLLGMNVNGGQKILIRLRQAHDPNSFLDLEHELVGTILHELTHNVRGPHDDVFFKQLDELQNEFDAILAKGYTGEGFLGAGSHLGQSHNLPPAEARALAIKKAQERERIARLLGKGGIVGGKNAVGDPRELRALAAERRAKAQRACGGHGEADGELSPEQKAEVARAEEDGKTITIEDSEEEEMQIIERTGGMPDKVGTAPAAGSSSSGDTKPKPIEVITLSSDDDGPVVSGSRRPVIKKRKHASSSSSPPFRPAKTLTPAPSKDLTWSCAMCTLVNPARSLACQACDRPRSGPSSIAQATPTVNPTANRQPESALRPELQGSLAARLASGGGTVDLGEVGWWCDRCGRTNDHLFWTCTGCGSVKTSSARG